MAFDIALLVGRILFGGYFAVSGLNHFMSKDELSGWAEHKGSPMPEIAVYISGLMLVLGGLGILAGAYPAVSLALVGIFLVVVTPWFHNFWDMDGEERQSHQINFMKNAALFGALLICLGAAAAVFTPYSLGMGLGIL